jgi:hypothetical protein
VVIDLGSGGVWCGTPGRSWSRASRHGRHYLAGGPGTPVMLIHEDGYVVPWYRVSGVADRDAGWERPPGTVHPVDAWKLFIEPRPGATRKEPPAEELRPGGDAEAVPAGPAGKAPDARANARAAAADQFRRRRYEDAAAYAARASHLAPEDGRTRQMFVLSLLASRQYDAAETELRKVLSDKSLAAGTLAEFVKAAPDAWCGKDELARQLGLLALRASTTTKPGAHAILVAWLDAVSGLRKKALGGLADERTAEGARLRELLAD